MSPYRLLILPLLATGLVMPTVAQGNDDAARLIFGIIGGVMNYAINQGVAKDSWNHVDTVTRDCFQHRHGLSVANLIRQGVHSDDARLRPVFVDCAQYTEQQRLQIEAERQRAEAAQHALIDLGYDPGPADGLWGVKTASAMREFQRDRGIPITGQLDGPSLQLLVSDRVVGSVEGGLKQLARAIAEKSRASGQNTIAVLPFPHSDGTCSTFSSYVVDELTLSLFDLPDAGIDIVERSRMESIISELAMGEGGLLNPATTKEIGSISGASALIIGTITGIGDSIRLNARLVATDTGRTISAAAETIPNTQAISSLLSQRMTCTISN